MLSYHKKNKHKLVVLGDSLAQGFKNGGVYRTDLSFPAFLNRCFEPEPAFHQPLFTAQGGIPINLEILVRGLSEKFGDNFKWNEFIPAATYLYTTLRRIKRYWEGQMKPLEIDRSEPYHNQSVWGFTINDLWLMTDKIAEEHIKNQPETYSVFDVLPDHAMYKTAELVLNPSGKKRFSRNSQIDNAHYLQQNGGIENLIVTVGHNNAIGAVTDLNITYSEEEELQALPADRKFTVYRPEHFEQEYRELAERVSAIGAKNVINQTIPYVTIPPVSRGVNLDLSRPRKGYFDYYTRFWIWDDDFDPDKHPHLTREEAIELDQTIDEYNVIIRDIAAEYGWITVPLNKHVNAIARRRQGGTVRIPFPPGFCKAMKRNSRTAHLVSNSRQPLLSTNYIKVDEDTGLVNKGGIFSLDGIHPTTIGYGLMAHTYYEAMEKNGIRFQHSLDWDYIIKSDTLVTDAPYLLVYLRKVLRLLSLDRQERLSMLSQNVLHQLLRLFTSRREEESAS